MTDFLDQVVGERRADAIAARAQRDPLPLVEDSAVSSPRDRFTSSLQARMRSRLSVIAEVKRVSPALGRLASADFDIVGQATRYVTAGATAISVLTEPRHWGGSLEDLSRIRRAVGETPILCKDVIVDEVQVVQAQEAGADAVLLIAEALTEDDLARLLARARALELGVLLEAHEPAAFERALAAGAVVVGVNARDLRRPSAIDPSRINDLHRLVRPSQVLVAESGIASADDVRRLPGRVDAVLVGTALMRAADPGALIAEITSIERVAA
jgi:indole-3-glycerol phosphate synthase